MNTGSNISTALRSVGFGPQTGAPGPALCPGFAPAGIGRSAQPTRTSAAPAGPAVLVIDANPDDVALLQAAAAEVGLRLPFSFITDGLQALAYLRGEGGFADRHTHPFPNVIILDVRFPGLDGFELLRQLRQVPQCHALTVLVWSDALDPAFGRRVKEAGADYFVPKFCSFAHLLQQARWFADLARQARSTPVDCQLA